MKGGRQLRRLFGASVLQEARQELSRRRMAMRNWSAELRLREQREGLARARGHPGSGNAKRRLRRLMAVIWLTDTVG